MKLHKPKGKNRWCGPNAISIVVGCSTDEAAGMIRMYTGRKQVTGTHLHELERVLKHYGYVLQLSADFEQLHIKGRPTLAAWLKLTKQLRTTGRVFLVSAGHHWQIISGRRFVDGIVREPISIRSTMAGRRRRVKAVHEVVKA